MGRPIKQVSFYFHHVVIALSFSIANNVNAFGVDVCFNNPDSGLSIITNCINVGEECRTSNLTSTELIACKVAATTDSLSGLTGSNAIIGGRSLVHSDATYLMAQLIGYSPWQAFEISKYSDATDQSYHTPFNQAGHQMLSDSTIENCQAAWGPDMPNECLLTTPLLDGLDKFNFNTGGMWLHLHARYSVDGNPPPAIPFPVDYLSPKYSQNEPLLTNFRGWLFDERNEDCVYGITMSQSTPTSTCAQPPDIINNPMNFFSFGFSRLASPFVTTLGTFQNNETSHNSSTPVYATNSSLQAYVSPDDAFYVKPGIFLHALQDRYSHHMCTDYSYFSLEEPGVYTATYNSVNCAQGNHFLWHVYEQGTNQMTSNLSAEYQTMKPSLEATYEQLVEYAEYKGISVNHSIDKVTLINQLIEALSIYDPSSRLNRMVQLMGIYRVLPLPGHGYASRYTHEQWLSAAGAPVHALRATKPLGVLK